MLFLGDSVDRETIGDVHSTAYKLNYIDVKGVLKEHWRSAIKLPMLEMVRCLHSASMDVLYSRIELCSTKKAPPSKQYLQHKDRRGK